MNVVLLSGGSGKRLWPLSNEVRSKQFLKLFKNGEGEYESMVQRNCRQLAEALPGARVLIATSRAQVPSLKNQLGGDALLCVEPERRDTFAAIVLSCACLKYELGRPDNEAVIIAPVDPYTEPGFFGSFELLEAALKETGCALALIGSKPTFPTAKYGYIFPEREGSEPFRVREFKEKPSEAEAARYIEEGALWNCGVFALTIGRALSYARKYINFASFAELERQFTALPKISFDYEVTEREQDIRVIEFSGLWRDLGTWNTLAEAMDSPYYGEVVFGGDCEGTSVINELGPPVLVMGLKNAVIAAGPDGIIVSDKRESSYIKPYVEAMELRPQYVEKAWGHYVMISPAREGSGSSARQLFIKKDRAIGPKTRGDRSLTFASMSGEVLLKIGEKELTLKAGDSLRVAPGEEYTLSALEDSCLIEIQLDKT
ncbi:MAG: sugar phosphate nucleotidyltransferase [Oscillospiraceae bacterium]|nr:sugar phosphate nucleotidyltransferase [Oscillospiraceae bacterium]